MLQNHAKNIHYAIFNLIYIAKWKPFPYAGEVRLFGGRTTSEGLVEIFLNGHWGTLCTSYFGKEEGNAVCRQLGYSMLVTFAKEQLYV